jgi:hypothetical protein
MLVFLGGIGPLEIVVFIALFVLWIWALIDVARNSYMKGSTKAIWLVVGPLPIHRNYLLLALCQKASSDLRSFKIRRLKNFRDGLYYCLRSGS